MKAVASPSVGSIARAAWSGVKYIRTLINVERHINDGTASAALVAGTPQLLSFHSISQGDTNGTRTGNSILLKTIQMKGYIYKHTSATQTLYQWFVVRDKQQVSDTAPAFTDIFDNASSMNCRLNVSNVGRFEILRRSGLISLTSNQPIKTINFYRKFKGNYHIRYNGTASTDIQKNGIYFILMSSEGTNTPTYDVNSRTTFYDN